MQKTTIILHVKTSHSIVDVEPNYKLPGAILGLSNYEEGISRYDLNFSDHTIPITAFSVLQKFYFKPDRDLFIHGKKEDQARGCQNSLVIVLFYC
jgi:hypothetical protein